jgi:hypothetical protein
MAHKKLDVGDKVKVESLVGELVDFIQGCYGQGKEPRIEDFSPVSRDGEQRSSQLNKLLELTGVPRFCSAEVLYRLFAALDEQFDGERKLPPESIRRKLLSGIGEALDEQERDVRRRIEGVLVLLHKSNECEQLLATGNNGPKRRQSLKRIVDQGTRIRDHLVGFMVANPSLMTIGVQSLFGEEDDPILVKGLIDSCGGQLDFIAQSSLIASQGRIRANHVNNAFHALSRAGIGAIEAFDQGLMDLLSLLEFDTDWDSNTLASNKSRVEQRIKSLMDEFENEHRGAIMEARGRAEEQVQRYAPTAVTELITNKTLNNSLAGDVIQGEGRLHAGIRLLKEGILVRRQELSKGWAFIREKAGESLEVETRALEEKVERLASEHDVLKDNFEGDVFREDHFQFELDRVKAELEVAREILEQQENTHTEIQKHVNELIDLQGNTMDRLLEQIEVVENRVRVQTKDIFKSLLGLDLNAQRQVDIIEFGDPELSMGLVIGYGKKLSPDAQVAVAKTVNRQLQRTLLRGMQDQLIVYARRFIPTELLLEVFREGDLNKGVYS